MEFRKSCKIGLDAWTLVVLLVVGMIIPEAGGAAANTYFWLSADPQQQALVNGIAVPEGYERLFVPQGSFQDWLRHLPLKPEASAVYLYDGTLKANQIAHLAVIDIDVGSQDLQQCADAIMRLRAEYLYSTKAYPAIHFNFTSGDTVSYSRWREGHRPIVKGNAVTWRKSAKRDASYANFRRYLETVFRYAGSYSLSQELQPVPDVHDMQIGDVFIQGGFPGHAVIVVDMAMHLQTGKKLFLLAQSFMPAQDMHVLHNFTNDQFNPWYDLDFSEKLETPEWVFRREHLKRFQ